MHMSHRSRSRRSAKHSNSSASTNRRTDSDIPSSDSTAPPTPRDGDVLISPPGYPLVARTKSGPVNYYDYSEQYAQESVEPQNETVPTGLVRHIKTIIEERGSPEPSPTESTFPTVDQVAQQVDKVDTGIAELPASPIPNRLTRDIVLAGIGPDSSSGDVESLRTAEVQAAEASTGGSGNEQVATRKNTDSLAVRPLASAANRHSILSQAGSSVMDSSTLEFAVRCSIPMVADKGITIDIDESTALADYPDADPTSEDGMTELLEGYQRSDTRLKSEDGSQHQTDLEQVEKQSNHAAKPSDEQSFKSCADLIDNSGRPAKNPRGKSFESCQTVPESDQLFKDNDARSFQTCKDIATPDRVASLPSSRLPSSQLVPSEPTPRRPFSAMPLSLPSVVAGQVPSSSASESNISRAGGKFRTLSSKIGSAHGSAAGSLSSIQEHGPSGPPVVPPRESSSSKEAQQSRGVGNFLLRSVRQRFAKNSAEADGASNKDDIEMKPQDRDVSNANSSIPTPPPMKDRTLLGNTTAPPGTQLNLPSDVTSRIQQANDYAASLGSTAPSNQVTDGPTSLVVMNASVRSLPHSTPSHVLPEASSVYSPDNISLNGSRVQASPYAYQSPPEHGRPVSQTTTHLSWHGGNSFQHPANADKVRDDSTTDLRASGYRHVVNHLPDLKEESHEDSSLNTSASNFRPFGGSQNATFPAFPEEVVVSRRHASVRSSRNSGLQQMHLPSMNFSSFGSFDDALDHRVSRSMELPPGARAELATVGVIRPASAGENRDKYKSVFAGLDTPARVYERNQHSTTESWMGKSPDSFVKEVDSLTIPSVNGLTTRLSEMLPKLKDALGMSQTDEFPDEEGIMEKALESLSEVGVPGQKRSSARLRPVPGSPNMLVVDDEVFKEISDKATKSSESTGQDFTISGAQAIGHDDAGRRMQAEAAGAGGGSGESSMRARARAETQRIELEAPPSAHLVHNNNNSLSSNRLLFHSTPSSRPSLSSTGSLRTTPTATATDTRPWNSDKNYPWATDPSVDISLPPPSASKQSPRPGPSHLRNRISDSSSEDQGTSADHAASALTRRARRSSNRIGHYVVDSQRVTDRSGLAPDVSGQTSGSLRVRDDSRFHGAGERYPTSALPLPPNLHIYAGQASNFSLDTSDEEPDTTTSPRKNLFGRRTRRSARATANRRSLTQTNARELQQSRATDHSTQEQTTRRCTFRNAEGMSRLEYVYGIFVLKTVNGAHVTWEFCQRLFNCFRPVTADDGSTASTASEPAYRSYRVPPTPDNTPVSTTGPDTQSPPALESFPPLDLQSEDELSAIQGHAHHGNYGTIATHETGPATSQ